jgi:type I restriction enzyme M protein
VSTSEASKIAIIVQQGKVLDFIDGKTQRNETAEEYVRQEIAKSLVREYRYEKVNIEVEFVIRVGTRKPRADLVIFPPGADHKQENGLIIVECKSAKVKAEDKKDGLGQLQSYMAACPNVSYGMWTNGVERFCYCRVVKGGQVVVEDVPDIPEFGREDEEEDRPRFDQLKPATSDALLFAFRRSHNYIAGNQGLQKPQAFWELLKLIFCKIQDERHNDEVAFYAAANERHGINGPLKVQKRIEGLFTQVKDDYPTIFITTARGTVTKGDSHQVLLLNSTCVSGAILGGRGASLNRPESERNPAHTALEAPVSERAREAR